MFGESEKPDILIVISTWFKNLRAIRMYTKSRSLHLINSMF